jgi:alpha-mannosidase
VFERLEAECHVVENGSLRGVIECTIKTGQSTAKITITLDALPASLRADSRSLLRFDCHVDWHERHRLLKFELPVDLWAQEATYDVAFGVVKRPTHRNTSWDAAKFEVPAHKFADYSEYGYGVALINDCKYGYSGEYDDHELAPGPD